MPHKLVIPERFLAVRYNSAVYPGIRDAGDLSAGANCQVFAYAILAHFGINFPPLRSSDLWADTKFTRVTTSYEPLDLLLFGQTADAYGAHVAVYVGEGRAIHLSREVGLPAEWPLSEFVAQPRYRILLGGKRPLRN